MARKSRKTRTPGLYRVDPSRIYPDGGWEIRYRDANRRTRRRTFRTKQAALDFHAAVRTDLNRGDWIDPALARTPFSGVAERWYRTTEGRKPKTRAGYRSILDFHLLPAFGPVAVSRIDPSGIRTLLAGTGVTVGTQRNILRVLSPILALAVDDNMIRTNPVSRVKLRNDSNDAGKEMPILTEPQVALLAEEVGLTYRVMVYAAAFTGLRAGELEALRVRDLDLMRCRITVREALSEVNGVLHFVRPKNGKQRVAAVPRSLADMLMAQTAGKDAADLVFPGPQGGPLRHGNFMGRHFRPAVERALPKELHRVRFHDLRHTCASILIAQGAHPLVVSRQLGHSSISITMDRYGHCSRRSMTRSRTPSRRRSRKRSHRSREASRKSARSPRSVPPCGPGTAASRQPQSPSR